MEIKFAFCHFCCLKNFAFYHQDTTIDVRIVLVFHSFQVNNQCRFEYLAIIIIITVIVGTFQVDQATS